MYSSFTHTKRFDSLACSKFLRHGVGSWSNGPSTRRLSSLLGMIDNSCYCSGLYSKQDLRSYRDLSIIFFVFSCFWAFDPRQPFSHSAVVPVSYRWRGGGQGALAAINSPVRAASKTKQECHYFRPFSTYFAVHSHQARQCLSLSLHLTTVLTVRS